MPEIKHDFSAGKMNKDFDERIVPNGEYRDAMNIQVRTTSTDGDSGNAGAIQNIQGNKYIKEGAYYESSYSSDNNESKMIASIANEKDNKAYFFLSSPNWDTMLSDASLITSKKKFIDTIIEIDTKTGTDDPSSLPVVVDKWGIIDIAQGTSTLPGVLYQTTNTSSSWQSFYVNDATDYRIGMLVQAYDSNGEEMFSALDEDTFNPVEIQNIDTDNNLITVYSTQSPVDWDTISFFTFRHPDRVLNFRNDIKITGLNIIDDLLFWTDAKIINGEMTGTEPKRINIRKCKEGSIAGDTLADSDWTNHTQLKLQDPIDDSNLFDFTPDLELSLAPSINNDIREEHVTVLREAPLMAPTLVMKQTDRDSENIQILDFFFDFSTYNSGEGPAVGDQVTVTDNDNSTPDILKTLNLQPDDIIKFKQSDGVFLTASVDEVNVIDCLDENGETIEGCTNDGETAITMTIMTFNGLLVAPNPSENDFYGYWTISLEQKKPLFELKIGRFGLRYKYEDGEYSSFGPWSELAFLPGAFDYDHKKGYNLGMTNTLRSLVIRDFIPNQRTRGADIVAVDILYKTTDSPNCYVVKTITRGRDNEWKKFTTSSPDATNNDTYSDGSPMFGEISITSEMIHKALPSSQLLRSWDNVPKLALGQEIAANRLVYANYEQGYEIKNELALIQNLKSDNTTFTPQPTETSPQKSVKSIREYKFGLVFGDRYGRETPVLAPGYLVDNASTGEFVYKDGSINVEKRLAHMSNRFQLTQDWPGSEQGPDDWISYVKYYVKETSSEYYNLVMDRWYFAEDGNIWLSFISADRNKLDIETYLILKNEHGNPTPVEERARYKILAIENQAPEFIKADPRPMGSVELGPGSFEWMFSDVVSGVENSNPPDILMDGTEITIEAAFWNDFLSEYDESQGDLQVRVTASAGGVTLVSNNFQSVTYHVTDSDGNCRVSWKNPFGEAANMYAQHVANLGSGSGTELSNMTYFLEFRELVFKNSPEFDGKFFVKIERDDILDSKVLQFEAGTEEWVEYESFPLAYIDNQQYNPSATSGPYANGPIADTNIDYMARKDYRWFDTTSVPANGDSGENLNMASITSLTMSNGNTLWQDDFDCGGSHGEGDHFFDRKTGTASTTYSSSNFPELEADDEPDGTSAGSYNSSTSAYKNSGCFSYDSEYMALGCADYDAIDNAKNIDGNPGDTWGNSRGKINEVGPWEGDATNSIGNTAILNRARETKDFWKWWVETSSFHLETKVFIDSVRTRFTELNGSGLICENGFDEDGNCIEDETNVAFPNASGWNSLGATWWTEENKVSGHFYKPSGIDQGVLSGDNFTDTLSTGHLGRIAFAIVDMRTTIDPSYWASSGWGEPGDAEYDFKKRMTTRGTLFKFKNDPEDSNIYKVVSKSTEAERYESYNYNEVKDSLYGDWTDHNYWGNAPSGEDNDHFVFHYADPHGINYGEFSHQNILWWINKTPFHHNGTDVYQSGYDGFPPWIGGIDIDGDDPHEAMTKRTSCQPCGTIYGNGGDSDLQIYPLYCRRYGIRIEFRKWSEDTDTSINSLGLTGDGDEGIDTSIWDPRGAVCHDGREAFRIAFIRKDTGGGEPVIPVSDAAIWETEPKENVDLDIYYEASNAIPTRLNSENTSNFAPYGSKISLKAYDSSENPGYINVNLDNTNHFVSHIGYTQTHSIVGIKSTQSDGAVNYQTSGIHTGSTTVGNATIQLANNSYIVFHHPDGTQTMSKVVSFMKPVDEEGNGIDTSTIVNTQEYLFTETNTDVGFYKLDSNVWKFPVELGWFNCYSFGNGVESDRIRDDFNAPQMDNGVKVSTTFLDYGKERRGSGMIYSGIYNSTSGINDLNEFNMSEKITKDINPTYGAIQKLKIRDTDIVVLTEDKVLKVTTNKDALFNADGNPQLLASNRVLGTAVPFVGDYGISQNPESLVSDQYRMYFTDMQRGAVLRLSRDGLTPISEVGMKTWFRDNLKKTSSLLGTFDSVNGEYNITLDYKSGENINNTTVSFNERSKGWVSFKSFIPQAGVSVGGKYLTAISKDIGSAGYEGKEKKGIYEHHVDITKQQSNSPNFGEIINRNVFYATDESIQCEGDSTGDCANVKDVNYCFKESTFNVLFNDIPGSVKSFRTVSYEGSQGRVLQFLQTGLDQVDPSGQPFINQTDKEFYNLNNKDGWWVSSIETDLCKAPELSGSVPEFIEKEGKWFNKVGGVSRENMEDKHLSEFSVQGLGNLLNIESTQVESIDIKIVSDMIDDDSNPYDPNADNNL